MNCPIQSTINAEYADIRFKRGMIIHRRSHSIGKWCERCKCRHYPDRNKAAKIEAFAAMFGGA